MKYRITEFAIIGIFVMIFIQTSLQVINSYSEKPVAINSTFPTGVAPMKSIPDLPKTSISFDTTFHYFGIIPDNKKVYTQFQFTNTGKEPLVIISAEGSCGCTVPEWPRESIPPGKTGIIGVAFDPNGKSGEQEKIVTVTSNTEPSASILRIKSTIVKSN